MEYNTYFRRLSDRRPLFEYVQIVIMSPSEGTGLPCPSVMVQHRDILPWSRLT